MPEYYRQSQNPKLPQIGSKTVSILSFGAKPDGSEKIDSALKSAVASLGEEGGTVLFPKGEYLSGAIHFTDHLRLHLEEGAVIRFSGDLNDYLPPVLGVFEGIRCYRPSALLHAEGKTDIAITGKGILDGNGEAWWDMVQYTAGVRHMLRSAEAGEPVENRVYSTFADGVRPCFLEFLSCSRILLEDVTFRHSPMWTVHPTWSEEITVRGIRIDNPMEDRFHHSQNTDGVNLDGCRNALVEGCTIYCGDDCVCMKSGKNADGRAAGHVCENVEVRNCHFVRGIGGITMGSETSGGIRNLYCHDIDMKDICHGIWIKSTPERGAFVENLTYENISMEAVCCSGFCLTLGYDSKENDGKFIPVIRNIHAENITMEDGKCGIEMNGIAGHEPYNVSLANVKMKAELPIRIENIKNVSLENLDLTKNPEYIQRM